MKTTKYCTHTFFSMRELYRDLNAFHEGKTPIKSAGGHQDTEMDLKNTLLKITVKMICCQFKLIIANDGCLRPF